MEVDELHATARMARLTLSEAEIIKLRQAVDQMLAYFTHLKNLDVGELLPTTHALARQAGLREDRETDRAPTGPLLDNAPVREDRFIVIPNVL